MLREETMEESMWWFFYTFLECCTIEILPHMMKTFWLEDVDRFHAFSPAFSPFRCFYLWMVA